MARNWKEFSRNAYVVGMLFGVVVFGFVSGLRHLGLLQSLELLAYDQFLSLRSESLRVQPRVTLIAATEEDLMRLDWPINDDLMAQILENVIQHGPKAVGVDIYRDVSRPPGHARLMQVIEQHDQIVMVFKLGEGEQTEISPPAALRSTSRVGFADVVPDPGGVVRRGLLFMDQGGTTYYSFALRLALKYLQTFGIAAQPGKADPSHVRLGEVTLAPFEANDGGYVNADAAGYQFLLDFRDGSAAFPTYTVSQALASAIPRDAVRDRVVIVGVAAQSVKDHFYTPLSSGVHADHIVYGMALHAQVTSQLLRMALDGSPPLRTASDWQRGGWLMLWCVLGGLVGARLRVLWGFVLAVIGGIAVIVLLAYAAFSQAWWIPVVPPALGLLASVGLATAHMSRLERNNRLLLMQLFSRYVSRDVADDIWQHRDEFLEQSGRPRPQRSVATILFSDIKGFTSVSEKMDPQALMDWLNTYMESMANLVMQHGGIVDKFIGDAVMAIFGVPVARSNDSEISQDAINAVACALAMGRNLEQLNLTWQERGLPQVSIRVGLFTGPVVAGSLGSRQRLEYTVIGDTVNIASRLESFEKESSEAAMGDGECRILIGEATARRLAGRFRIQPIGEVQLKGKDDAIMVYRVLGVAKA